MSDESLKQVILANADELRRLNARINETYQLLNKPDGARNWQQACEAFHSNYDRLAFPGGYDGALERLKMSDPATVDAALCFLEVRPFFFRSGYMFKDILRKVKRCAVNREQAERLERIVVAYDAYRAQRRRHNVA